MNEDKILINTSAKITVEIFKFETLERLKEESEKLDRSWDELFNIAIKKIVE